MRNKATFGLLLGLLLPSFALAENLLDIYHLSLANDPEINAAKHAQKANQEIRPQALAKLFPTIKVHSRAGKAGQDVLETWIGPTNGANPLLGKSLHNDIRLSLSLSQPVFNLSLLKTLKVSDSKLLHAELKYRIALQALLLRVAEQYFNVLSAQESLNFFRSQKTAIAQQLQATKHRFDIGLVAATNVYELQAIHDLALANEMKAETLFANQKENLRRLTGKKTKQLTNLKNDTPLIPPTPNNVEDWIESAKSSNLKIAEKKLQVEILRLEKDVIRANNYPTIDFNIRYGYNQYGGAFRTTTLDGLVSIDFNMVLFEGNISASRLNQKQHRLEYARQLTEAKEREVLQQTRNAYLGVLTGMSYAKALAQALKSSERAFQSTKAGFDVGTRTSIDVLNAQRSFFTNKKNLVLARHEYALNTLRLKAAVGLLAISDLKQINDWLE